MTTLLLIRHGQSQANLTRHFAGHYDPDLTELGLKQAACTADFLVAHYPITAVYSSDLKRAYQTGFALAQRLNLPVHTDMGLREIYAGAWEGKTFDQISTQFPEEYHYWLTDIGHCRPTGGESTAELAMRMEDTLRHIAEENPDSVVAVATHAMAIRALRSRVSGVGAAGMKDIPWPVNASVTELHYQNGEFTLGKIDRAEHLNDLRTDMPANV